jgi:hypothetical protein
MDELRVPKHRLSVEVLLPGGATRRMALFLSEAAPGHGGPERPLDLLNGKAEFIPAVDESTGQMTFLHRSALSAVRVPREVEPDELPTIPIEHEVELLLVDGALLRGLVSYLRPEGHARLVDVLNEPPPFLRLLEGDTVTLVNKRHVARVALIASE